MEDGFKSNPTKAHTIFIRQNTKTLSTGNHVENVHQNNPSRALGFFENCEVLIPDYLMKCLDQYLSGSKTTISNEIAQLRDLERKGLIKIKSFNDGFDIPASREEFNVDEDTTLLDIADITNSVFITCDINCKDQATLRDRPVIFIDHETTRNTKILHEIRTPS